MSAATGEPFSVLALHLHGYLLGHLVGFRSGKNTLLFDPAFAQDVKRPTLSLLTHPQFPHSAKLLAEDWTRHQRLHPLLSNMLPEGALRELLAFNLKIHIDHEFELLAWLGNDLPGALTATPMEPEQVPPSVLNRLEYSNVVDITTLTNDRFNTRFSLAGVQMKFSMRESDGRFTLAYGKVKGRQESLGNWIIKTPSTQHRQVPENEYTGMTLASLAGVDIPDIRLVSLDSLDNLPPINLPQEEHAFAIRRFDRLVDSSGITRIHMEDFAQVLAKYPQHKYNGGNYDQIGNIVYRYSADGIADVQQLARRLLVNILLANGDAHLKNWSLVYPDRVMPQLSPAYDILTTKVYMQDEQEAALNMARQKRWLNLSLNDFERWAKRTDIPWKLIQPHLADTLDKARALWPSALKNLPMAESHKRSLGNHWQHLHPDFQIK